MELRRKTSQDINARQRKKKERERQRERSSSCHKREPDSHRGHCGLWPLIENSGMITQAQLSHHCTSQTFLFFLMLGKAEHGPELEVCCVFKCVPDADKLAYRHLALIPERLFYFFLWPFVPLNIY